jgi:hypothetical protein
MKRSKQNGGVTGRFGRGVYDRSLIKPYQQHRNESDKQMAKSEDVQRRNKASGMLKVKMKPCGRRDQ